VVKLAQVMRVGFQAEIAARITDGARLTGARIGQEPTGTGAPDHRFGREEHVMQHDPIHVRPSLEHRHSGRFTRRRVLGAGGAAAGLAAAGPLRTWAAPARQDEPVALKFITLGEEWAEHMQEVIDAFEAANPGITVEMETYPFRQLFEIIEVRMQAQSADVDLISVDVPLVASYSVRGFLHPLDAYFTPEEMESTWVPASVNAGIYNDQFMAAPQNSSTQFMYINPRIFADAGVEPPPAIEDGAAVDAALVDAVVEGRWTWEQVVEAAQALTADTNGDGAPDTWGMMFDQVSRPYQILALPESLNQPSVSEDGLSTDGYLNSENWVRAATFYGDLYNALAVSPKGVTADNSYEVFAAGNAAMYVGGEWNILRFAAVDDLEFAIAAHPYFADGRVATPTGSWHVGVSAFSEKQDAAAEFVRFITLSPEGSQIWFDSHGQFPATTALLDRLDNDETYAEFPLGAYRLGAYEARNTAVGRPQTPGYLEFEDILATTLEDIRNGSDPASSLDAAVQRIDRALARYR
jgi:ABC-type glycerol-3-phosphate transport system substrate-binding protein